MPPLPPELWRSIFSHLSIISNAVDSEAVTWANIATGNNPHWETSSATPKENLKAMRALALVSKGFHELSRKIALEFVILQTVNQLECFARTLRERPQIASAARQYTKRLDVVLNDDPKFKNLSRLDESTLSALCLRSQSVVMALTSIFKACPALAYLTIGMDSRFVTSDSQILTAFSGANRSLEVLRWNFASQGMAFPMTYCVIPLFHGLRVLDVSGTENAFHHKTLANRELPHLHTLIGAFRILCIHFHDIKLPSLRTLVISIVPISIRNVSAPVFFRNHGENIQSLGVDDAELFDGDLLTFFPSVAELVLRWNSVKFLDRGTHNVKKLGILGDIPDAGFAVLKDLVSQRESGEYPKLRTVRFLQPKAVERLWNPVGVRELQELVERLRTWSISLEDDSGNPLFPRLYAS